MFTYKITKQMHRERKYAINLDCGFRLSLVLMEKFRKKLGKTHNSIECSKKQMKMLKKSLTLVTIGETVVQRI